MPSHEETVGGYKPGSLRRIKLKNFITYSDVEFSPGPRLNMVVGPNGTGKSSLLCAICLGLGGEPRLLGRATDVDAFITNEKDRATIEIELAPFPDSDVHIIKRVIEHPRGERRKGLSTFYINNEKVSAKTVRELVADTYSISVDNLCTFLPQDRVGNFSGLNPQELLLQTEKSMQGTLFETHQQLIEMEDELRKGGASLESVQEKLRKLEAENERLEREKERMEERELALEQAEILEKKYVWLKFDAARAKAVSCKEEKDRTKQKLREANEKVVPLEEAHGSVKANLQRTKARFETLDSSTKRKLKDLDKHDRKHEHHSDQIDMLSSTLRSLDAEQRNVARLVEQSREKVTKLETQMADHPSMEELVEASKNASQEARNHRHAFEQARKTAQKLSAQRRELQEQEKIFADKLRNIQDEKKNRRDRMFRQQPDLLKICDWLSQNRKLFRHPVHGPVACEVTTRNNTAASYLEFHVPVATLKSFVVLCREDYNLLYTEIRQKMNIPINIQVVKGLEPIDREYSAAKMEILRRDHGVLGYLDESFKAPDPILQALRSSAKVHKVLVGNEKTHDSLDKKKLLEYLAQPEDGSDRLKGACIFSSKGDKSFRFTLTISRYSGKPSTRIDEVSSARMLQAGVNASVKAKAEKELEAVRQKLNETEPELAEAQASEEKLRHDQQALQARAKEASAAQHDLSKLKQKLSVARRKLKDAEEAASADTRDEKAKVTRKLMARIGSCIDALDAHADCHRDLMSSTFVNAGVRINRDALAIAEQKAKDACLEAKSEFKEIEQEAIAAKNAFDNAKKMLEELRKHAREIAPLQDEDGNALPLKTQLDELPVETLEETEAALEEARAKANSIDANPDIIREYEQRKKEIARIREQLELHKETADSKVKAMEKAQVPWESALERASREVNELFAKYMEELGCAGEVRLSKGTVEGHSDNDDVPATGNFKNWGIDILVRFREKAKLQKLSAQVQSGGERSVSTIMYLMALQELMVSPFRCVDEINQGLDERNERLVFRRIVENSTKPPPARDLAKHSGQYFLITPKLLPNLHDMEVEAMTVLFIFNGPYGFETPLDWKEDEIVEAGKRRCAEVEEESVGDERDENTPAGINGGPSDESPTKKRRM